MTKNVPIITATLLAGIPEFVGAELGPRARHRVFSDAGLRHSFRPEGGVYIPEASVVKIIESAAQQAGDGALGALLGSQLDLGAYDTWGAYILEAKTLGESLKRFSNVMSYVASHSTASVTLRGAQARLNYRWTARTSSIYRQLCFASAGSLLNTLRHYLGRHFVPDEIHLDVPRPDHPATVEDHLPTRIVYDAAQISLVFSRALLTSRRRSDVVGVPLTLADVRRQVLPGPPQRFDTVVEELVRLQVQSGGPSLEQTALALDVNVRTLHRMLDRHGEGFRTLSRRVRLGMARDLLQETDMTVRAVAESVGYSDAYNFSRAFHKFFGTRPTQMQAS